jgi:hypothetical protein
MKKISRKLVIMIAASILAIVPMLVSTAAPASAKSGATIVDKWKDSKGRVIILRQGIYSGGKGFGWEKITGKHSIKSMRSLHFISAVPNGGKQQGASRIYEAYANRLVCTNGRCRVTDSVPVRLVVNFNRVGTYYGVAVNGVLGVQTAYCINDDKAHDCPSWVDKALGG